MQLNEKSWKVLEEACNAPAMPTLALIKLMRKKK